MLGNRVRALLDEGGLDYRMARHAEAFTARAVAVASYLPPRDMAKAILVRDGGGRYLMAVVPADCRLDLEELAKVSGHHALTLATEEEVTRLFADCEPGAVPPFGNLYHVPTFLDACLCEVPDEVYFSAGSHREVVGMLLSDYLWAARPMLGQFCLHAHAPRSIYANDE